MSRTIEVLRDVVANQIAAGEVVERPASVVKELVENALDARATAVEVAIERGGKRLIRVADDGSGMSREDALLCLDRHATSKITAAEDLRRVATFGFRGEALPSIAAVSRLALETWDGDDDVGTALRVEGGRLSAVDDRPRRRGTTVEARNLFFNAPARAKFLKSVSAEARAVSDAVTTLALANPGVGFTLASDGRALLELPPAHDVAERVAALWGEEAAGALLPVRGEGGVGGRGADVEMLGLVQRPDAAGPGSRRAFLFVNGRPFKDPALLAAVDRAYRTTVAASVRPWCFLYLRVPDGSVDVNVHPAKAEVRFRDGALVEERVEAAVRDALTGEASAATFDAQLAPPRLLVRERKTGPARGGGAGGRSAAGAGDADARAPVDEQMVLFVAGGHSEAPPAPVHAERPRLWQALGMYILAETKGGLLIVDQHSAHERVLFEGLMDAFSEEGQEAQRLLFPLTLRLSVPEVEQVAALAGLLRRAGFEVEGFGGGTVIVHAVPNPHPWFDAERCFREMIAELTQGSELVRAHRNQHERIAATFACKGAIKAGQRLSPDEMGTLIDALFATELPYHDVHGRPTVVRLSSAELERKFGR